MQACVSEVLQAVNSSSTITPPISPNGVGDVTGRKARQPAITDITEIFRVTEDVNFSSFELKRKFPGNFAILLKI